MSDKFTPLLPRVSREPTTLEQDRADYFLYLAGQAPFEERFRQFMPKKSRDSLEAYVLTNGL